MRFVVSCFTPLTLYLLLFLFLPSKRKNSIAVNYKNSAIDSQEKPLCIVACAEWKFAVTMKKTNAKLTCFVIEISLAHNQYWLKIPPKSNRTNNNTNHQANIKSKAVTFRRNISQSLRLPLLISKLARAFTNVRALHLIIFRIHSDIFIGQCYWVKMHN